MKLPPAIERLTAGKQYTPDQTGLSGARVMIFDDAVLKILPFRPENDASVNMMRWLEGKLPVPKVLCYEQDGEYQYLLMSRLRGRMSCDTYYLERPDVLLTLMAEALKMLWAVDITGCPRSRNTETELREARYRVEHGLVNIDRAEPSTFGAGGFKDPEDLLRWLESHQPDWDPVLSHGDFCLPNVLIEDGKISGYIDLGDAGVGDRWRDIALCCRSLRHNFDGTYGGKVYPEPDLSLLFEKLGIEPDPEKLRYYTLLDELF